MANESEIPEANATKKPTIYRSSAFWYSDVQNAAGQLVQASQDYHPNDREKFLDDAYRAAKAELKEG